jgi:hypothetical protein
MDNLQDYINLSETALSVAGSFTSPELFAENYFKIHNSEKYSFLRHYIINNDPFLFQFNPLLFEQLIQYLSEKLDINTSQVKLIGSAKTGFSISPPPTYGKPFSNESDLDFSIIDEEIFNNLKEESLTWSEQYQAKLITPKNEREEFFWNDNLYTLPNQIERGFIDTHKIPNFNDFPNTKKINNILSLIVYHLNAKYTIEVKKTSARVYESYKNFERQIKLNTEHVFTKLK